MSGHYVSIQSFRDVYTVSQTTLVKLIVITNCKDLNHFLACGNFANLCCQGYLYFGSREKYFIVSYGMLIHLWYLKKWKDYIDIWTFYDQIPRTSRTNKSQINTMMKQRWGLDRNVLPPTPGDPGVSNNTNGTLKQKKTNRWTLVDQATDKKAPAQTN